MDKTFESNQVTIAGTIASEFTLSHDIFGENFYTANLSVERLSGTYDTVPIMVSERLFDVHHDCTERPVEIFGQLRTYNQHEGNKSKLVLSVFAREIKIIDELPDSSHTNSISLDGYLCKDPVYRKTPLGREIADLHLAVNRPYGKSDYIPCICWGRNAMFAESLKVGDHIRLSGRIQSREYQKRISEDEAETRTAYEVSVSRMESIGGEDTE